MKKERERNARIRELAQMGLTYEEIGKLYEISRQRAWEIAQEDIHRKLTALLTEKED